MATVLEIFRASGGRDVEIPTLELSCPAWDASKFICGGFYDQVFTTEDGRTVTFQAAGIDVALPKKDTDGSQQLGIAIDNVRGDAQLLLDQAKEAGELVTVIYRSYLDSDHSAPADRPIRMSVLSASMSGASVQLSCGYFDLINAAWPRDRYTSLFAPGLKYVG